MLCQPRSWLKRPPYQVDDNSVLQMPHRPQPQWLGSAWTLLVQAASISLKPAAHRADESNTHKDRTPSEEGSITALLRCVPRLVCVVTEPSAFSFHERSVYIKADQGVPQDLSDAVAVPLSKASEPIPLANLISEAAGKYRKQRSPAWREIARAARGGALYRGPG